MSKLNDINRDRRRSIATTYRGDIRTIATLLTFWHQKGESPQSLVSLLRLSVEAFKEMIIDKYPEYEFTLHASAAELLERTGLLDLSKKGPNVHSLIKELSLESMIDDGLDPIDAAVAEKRGKKGPYISAQEKEDMVKQLEIATGPEIVVRREGELTELKDQLGRKPEEGGGDG